MHLHPPPTTARPSRRNEPLTGNSKITHYEIPTLLRLACAGPSLPFPRILRIPRLPLVNRKS
jgi:hypothetical protein